MGYYFREDITFLMSMHVTLETTILLTISFTYVNGSFEHVILLAYAGLIETKKVLNSLAMSSLSVTILLLILNDNFRFELLDSIPINNHSSSGDGYII